METRPGPSRRAVNQSSPGVQRRGLFGVYLELYQPREELQLRRPATKNKTPPSGGVFVDAAGICPVLLRQGFGADIHDHARQQVKPRCDAVQFRILILGMNGAAGDAESIECSRAGTAGEIGVGAAA